MKNINSIFFSKYTRVLINGNECIVGNIAFDGRWIKMSHSLYKDLVQKSQNNISLLSEKEKKYINAFRIRLHVMRKQTLHGWISNSETFSCGF